MLRRQQLVSFFSGKTLRLVQTRPYLSSFPGQPVTTTKSPPQAGPTEAEDGFPIIIVALSIGIVALLVIIVLAVFFFRKRRIKKRPSFKGISLRE